MATALRKTVRSKERSSSSLALVRALIIIYVVLGTAALLALAFWAHSTPYSPLDLQVERAIQSIQAPWFDALMRIVGLPGYPPQVYAVCGAILLGLWLLRLKWEAVAEAFAIVGIGVVGLAVKLPVDRPRPSPELVHVANPALDGGKYSFPAGHVESYVAIFGFLIYLLLVLGRPGWLRTLAIILLGAMIVLIGPSRLYVGEHWLTDDIAAYLVGSLWLIATIYFYKWGQKRFFRNERARSPAARPR